MSDLCKLPKVVGGKGCTVFFERHASIAVGYTGGTQGVIFTESFFFR